MARLITVVAVLSWVCTKLPPNWCWQHRGAGSRDHLRGAPRRALGTGRPLLLARWTLADPGGWSNRRTKLAGRPADMRFVACHRHHDLPAGTNLVGKPEAGPIVVNAEVVGWREVVEPPLAIAGRNILGLNDVVRGTPSVSGLQIGRSIVESVLTAAPGSDRLGESTPRWTHRAVFGQTSRNSPSTVPSGAGPWPPLPAAPAAAYVASPARCMARSSASIALRTVAISLRSSA
jgi:hypothetical protein